MKMLEYKGYFGNVDASIEDNRLFGKLQFISALVSYEGETIADLKAAFEEAVDDYLSTCLELGYEPEISCKGSLNVRLGHELHLQVALKAKSQHKTLNEFICETLKKSLAANKDSEALPSINRDWDKISQVANKVLHFGGYSINDVLKLEDEGQFNAHAYDSMLYVMSRTVATNWKAFELNTKGEFLDKKNIQESKVSRAKQRALTQ